MYKLYCCGITSNETEKIRDLIQITKDTVDGYIWCVDSNPNSNDTYRLLEENKKEGRIVRHEWHNAHDCQANEWLHCGILKDGDWVWMLDSSETPTEYWVKWIRQGIQLNESNNIVANFISGRPYLFKYNDYLYFHGTPHWGLYGLSGHIATFNEQDKDNFVINKRNLNPEKHYQEHDTKYYLYGRSNQIQLFYNKYGDGVINYHERKRKEFRTYLAAQVGIQPGLAALDMLFTVRHKSPTTWTEFEIEMLELEFCLSEYFQRTILGMDFMTTMHPRYKWSFRNYLYSGDGWKDKSYEGTIIRYNKILNSQP